MRKLDHYLSCALLSLLAAPAAAADLDVFEPSGSLVHGSGTVQGESPTLSEDGPAVAVMGWVADDLAVLEYSDGSESEVLGLAFATPLYAAWTVEQRARIEILAPIYFKATSQTNDFSGAAFGELTVRGLVPIWAANEHFALAALGAIGFPTGTRDAYVSRGWNARITAVMGGAIEPHTGWLLNLGLTGAPGEVVSGITFGSSFDALAGFWYEPVQGFRLGIDGNTSVGVSRLEDSSRHVLWTAHGFAQLRDDNGITIAAGAGLGAGVGAPDFRVFAEVGFKPRMTTRAKPAATVLSDRDSDGVADDLDLCPDLPGPAEQDGCGDSDGDGVRDDYDQCPREPGEAVTAGCADSDGDLVPDFRDDCPTTAAAEDADPEFSHGCVTPVWVTREGTIRTERRITFEPRAARVDASAEPVLSAIAAVLSTYPTLGPVEVGGHTDNKGTPEDNLALSEQRAQGIVDYLIASGIEPERLQAKGYGHVAPIDTNRTTAGRANNRRIEFRVLPKP